jgi:hypothetical protein
MMESIWIYPLDGELVESAPWIDNNVPLELDETEITSISIVTRRFHHHETVVAILTHPSPGELVGSAP